MQKEDIRKAMAFDTDIHEGDGHDAVREMAARGKVDYSSILHELLDENDESDARRENANVSFLTMSGREHVTYSNIAQAYYLNEVIPRHIADEHLSGAIHIHDLNYWGVTFNCIQHDGGEILRNGFHVGTTHLREPGGIMAATSLASVFMQASTAEGFGGRAIASFDADMAPYVEKTYTKKYTAALREAIDLVAGGDDGVDAEDVKSLIADAASASGTAGPVLDGNDAYERSEAALLSERFGIGDDECARVQKVAKRHAYEQTDKETYQAMEAYQHNAVTQLARSGGQTVFNSTSMGTCTSTAGRMVIENALKSLLAGVGGHTEADGTIVSGTTPIFPIWIFKVRKGVNRYPGDPNYDMYKLAQYVSSVRLFPNFVCEDAPVNMQYYKEGHPETEFVTMGCRTRVISNIYDPENVRSTKRGNLFFTTINLPRAAMEADGDIDRFYEILDERLALCYEEQQLRFEHVRHLKAKNFPFMFGEDTWVGSGKLLPEDEIGEVLKEGTFSIGFCGLAEALIVLTGHHHGEDERARKLGIEIIAHMRSYTDRLSQEEQLNWSTFATPAESTAGKFARADIREFGLERISEIICGHPEFYTNSFHVPVWYQINAYDKIDIEAPYHELCNAGAITYVEMDGDPSQNLEAFSNILEYMMDRNIIYASINHKVDMDEACGYIGILPGGDVPCPKCGRLEGKPMSFEMAEKLGKIRTFAAQRQGLEDLRQLDFSNK
jgi:ribonucleoside-triphosphate reductase